jgi:hypothetical protein
MRTPSIRTRRIVSLTVGPVAVLLAGMMVWQGSSAAFTATTRNGGNNWSTGSVMLTDDDNGTAGFQVSHMTPMQTGSKCIVVTSTSSLPGVVKAYIQNLQVSAQGLEKYVTLQVVQGTGGSFNDCTGFVADAVTPLPAMSLEAAATTATNYATGMLPWSTTGNTAGESITYKGTWVFDTSALTQMQIDALQGATVSMDMVWELQSN